LTVVITVIVIYAGEVGVVLVVCGFNSKISAEFMHDCYLLHGKTVHFTKLSVCCSLLCLWLFPTFIALRLYILLRDVTKFEFDDVRTSNVFTRFEIRRMF